MKSLRLLAIAVGIAALIAGPGTASAQPYPNKPIRMVIAFPPGATSDFVGRVVAAKLAEFLGQPVVVDNKPGAGTIIGTDVVAKSPPDGYTLLVATFAHAVNPSMQPKLPFPWDKSFAPVVLIGRGPNVLVVKADSPYKSVKDVIAAAKANPGKLTYAS